MKEEFTPIEPIPYKAPEEEPAASVEADVESGAELSDQDRELIADGDRRVREFEEAQQEEEDSGRAETLRAELRGDINVEVTTEEANQAAMRNAGTFSIEDVVNRVEQDKLESEVEVTEEEANQAAMRNAGTFSIEDVVNRVEQDKLESVVEEPSKLQKFLNRFRK